MVLAEQETQQSEAREKPERPRRQQRSRRLRERALEKNDETTAGLEQVFEAKLAAVQCYEQRLNSVTDPYARKSLERMIRQERKELLQIADLIDLVEESPDMGRLALARRRLNHQLRGSTGRGTGFWLGAALVGAVMLPSVREKLRPLAVKAVQEVMELSDHARELFSGVKEDIEDLVCEAQFENMREELGPEGTPPATPGGAGPKTS